MTDLTTTGLTPEVVIADEHLASWASTFLQIAAVSAELAKTPFVPQSLRAKDERGRYNEGATAANVAAAIMTGREIGLEPMAALQSINVIQGTPAPTALGLRAVVLRAGHHLRLVDANDTRAIYEGRRHGEEDWQRITWTIDHAKSLGLAGREQWRKQPRNMLIARASSAVCRLVAPDAILGIPYSVEELTDGDVIDGGSEPPLPDSEPPKRKKAQRRTTKAVLEPPSTQQSTPAAESLSEAPRADEEATEEPGQPPVSPEQVRALHASFGEVGLKGREERLRMVQGVIGREVSSSKDLTQAEASAVLDNLAMIKTWDREEDEPEVDG